MTLLRRVSRLLTADVHAVLDRLEAPEAVLKQAIRDMEESVASLERRIQARRSGLAALDRRLAELDRALSDTDAHLDLCLARDDEALARGLVRRKLETRRRHSAIGSERDALAEDETALAALAARQREELEDLCRKAAALIDTPHCSPPPRDAGEFAVDDTEVELALLAEKQARTGR